MNFSENLLLYTLLIAVAIGVGGLLPLIQKRHVHRLPMILSLSAGLMLGSVFFHLIPEAAEYVSATSVGLYVLLGLLFFFIVERIVTVHVCEIFECEVHRIGISAMIGISLHTLLNGAALGSSLLSAHTASLSLSVFLAIASHKAPEAFSLTSVLQHTGLKRFKIVLIQVSLILMIPLGALLAYLFLQVEAERWIGRALALSAGTFLHIALSDLLPEAHRHSESKVKTTLVFLAGLAISWGMTRWLHPH